MRATLTNERLVVRPPGPDDARAVYLAVRESRVALGRWMPWCHSGYSLADSTAWIGESARQRAAGLAFEFGIFDAKSNACWGSVGVNMINRAYNVANLGFWVRTSRTRRGVALAAARLAARYAFNDLALTRLEIVALTANVASRGVAEKLGATLECIARNRLLHDGRPAAAAVYSLIPGDLADPPERGI